jgi:L,D-transpeptidase catalytic domain
MRASRIAAVLFVAALAAAVYAVVDREPAAEAAGTRFDAVWVTPTAGPKGRGFETAWLRNEVVVRDKQEGKPVARLAPRTRWGTPRILSVVKRKPGWLGVVVHQRPNGRLGWIRRRSARLIRVTEKLVVDLSERRLTAYRNGRVRKRIRVTVGKPASPTPTGRFALTDTLLVRGPSPYGCCVLALAGRQPNLPADWTGGNRLAIHEDTESAVGAAASLGCPRASRRDMRWLVRQRYQAGTPVVIRK